MLEFGSSNAAHFYRTDGLLEASPIGPHPIFQLIENAESAWEEKRNKASKTLKEAYMEYQRRYGRRPPRGFEVWWSYVSNHSVPLPDEYDQIDRDLSPFWSIDPRELQEIQSEWEGVPDSFTIGKGSKKGGLGLVNHTELRGDLAALFRDGTRMVLDVLDPVKDHLPPFRAVFNPHDNPNLSRNWDLRQEARKMMKAGKCRSSPS